MKYFFALSFLLFTTILSAQNVQSPDQFLGYRLGTKFTRHHRIVEYFNYVASAQPNMVKIEKFGETNEGRDLILAVIASPENLQKLEDIRKNNLRLTGMLNDTVLATTQAPAVVWLSYNVHGNEPSSSEAAMQTLYELINPNNQQAKNWLQNTVVIIDPCVNPDGRDRYVNWYNTTVGKDFNADPQSREHNEPWPGGRSNHYNFDLNRDWAWQTQIEMQQLLKVYNEWMPQVHVDYHEQGYNSPYYFAPAAEPYHEVITQWQRDFQIIIGKNNAKYFDENGWLFFTKEEFDLFYPSYGDTYPTFNGAIGMTFEQAGIGAGLGIVTDDDGDTLTLVDRIKHHITTGLSTIEVSSKHAQQLLDEYKKFFDDNRNAKNAIYKTYILTSNDENKILAVKNLLDKNKIEYGTVKNDKVNGYRYFTGKEESLQLNNFTIAISAYQSKSSLVRVLFEPNSKLNDSATYDITAWSIPYVYGVEGVASKEKLPLQNFSSPQNKISVPGATYGYIIPYHSFNTMQALAFLLKNNIKVRVADKPFIDNNVRYERGTLVVLKTGNTNSNWVGLVQQAATKYNVQLQIVNSGFADKGVDFGSSDIRFIHTPHLAMLTGEQVSSTDAGEVWNYFEQDLDYPITLINANDFGRINLKNYNVLIMPDGYYRFLSDKSLNDKLKTFVHDGGRIIAMQNAVAQLAKNDWGIKLKDDKPDDSNKTNDDYADIKKYADEERNDLSNFIPGAIYKVNLDTTHPLAYGFDDNYFALKLDGNAYEFLKDGWNVGTIKKNNLSEGFVGYKIKSKLKDGTLIGSINIDNGQFVFIADNPIFRQFWYNGKQLLANAVFLEK